MIYPRPIPEHYGVKPGQCYRSKLGSLYRVYAITDDGYVWCVSYGQEKRIWIDVVSSWTLVEAPG